MKSMKSPVIIHVVSPFIGLFASESNNLWTGLIAFGHVYNVNVTTMTPQFSLSEKYTLNYTLAIA